MAGPFLPMQNYLLVHRKAAGDTIAATALIRDLALAYPGMRFGAAMTGSEDILAGNPYLTDLHGNDPGVIHVKLDYRDGMAAVSSGIPVYYLAAYHCNFTKQTGLTVPFTNPKPELYLTDEEVNTRPIDQPYWLVLAGGKKDMTTKIYPQNRFQQIVNGTPEIRWVQIGARGDDRFLHIQHDLQNVTDLVGKTSLRQLFQLVYHSDGVLCGPTQTMLIAAAFDKPCVVLAGGREPYEWLAFEKGNPSLRGLEHHIKVPHRYLHTIGKLDCCAKTGCWACQVIPPHNDSAFPPGYICKRPVLEQEVPITECFSLIHPTMVIEAIRSYRLN